MVLLTSRFKPVSRALTLSPLTNVVNSVCVFDGFALIRNFQKQLGQPQKITTTHSYENAPEQQEITTSQGHSSLEITTTSLMGLELSSLVSGKKYQSSLSTAKIYITPTSAAELTTQ